MIFGWSEKPSHQPGHRTRHKNGRLARLLAGVWWTLVEGCGHETCPRETFDLPELQPPQWQGWLVQLCDAEEEGGQLVSIRTNSHSRAIRIAEATRSAGTSRRLKLGAYAGLFKGENIPAKTLTLSFSDFFNQEKVPDSIAFEWRLFPICTIVDASAHVCPQLR